MNPWWLLLIVPAGVLVGAGVTWLVTVIMFVRAWR